MSIRFKNTRTGKTTDARDMRDAAQMLRIESDRRSGAELAAQDRQRGAHAGMPAEFSGPPMVGMCGE